MANKRKPKRTTNTPPAADTALPASAPAPKAPSSAKGRTTSGGAKRKRQSKQKSNSPQAVPTTVESLERRAPAIAEPESSPPAEALESSTAAIVVLEQLIAAAPMSVEAKGSGVVNMAARDDPGPKRSGVGKNGLVWKLLAAAGLLVAVQIAVWTMRIELTPDPSAASISLDQWPLKLGRWTGTPTTLADNVVRHSHADTMGTWLYVNPLGERVLAHAGVWTKYEAALPHPPELCYAGSGWNLVNTRDVLVAAPEREPAQARLYRFEQQGRHILVLAWYQFGDATIVDRNELRRLFQRWRHTSQPLPPAIKVMLQAQAEEPARAEEELLEVASLLRAEAGPLQSAAPLANAPAGAK